MIRGRDVEGVLVARIGTRAATAAVQRARRRSHAAGVARKEPHECRQVVVQVAIGSVVSVVRYIGQSEVHPSVVVTGVSGKYLAPG
jgi:hypothetical protein